jgi:hypothetical protein
VDDPLQQRRQADQHAEEKQDCEEMCQGVCSKYRKYNPESRFRFRPPGSRPFPCGGDPGLDPSRAPSICRSMSRSTSWMSLAMDGWMLGMDASLVAGLRVMKISAGGPGATAEAQRMVTEKVEAAVALQLIALTGGLGYSVESAAARSLKHYGPKVRANRRRVARRTGSRA